MFVSEQILVFLGVLVTTGLLMKWRKKKEISAYSHPPNLLSLPFIGSIDLLFIRDSVDIYVFFMKKAREIGSIFTVQFGNRRALILNSKDAIEKAYVKNSSTFTDRPEIFMELLVNPENKGVIFKQKASEWKKPQKLCLSVLKEFGFGSKNIMETKIHKEIEAITDYIKGKKGESFDPRQMCFLLVANIIINMVFGRRREYELGLAELSVHLEHWSTRTTFLYDVAPFLRFLPSHRKELKQYVEIGKSLFECIESELDQSLRNTDVPCFVQSYVLKVGPDYDRAQLNYISRDMVAAGTDTTGTTMLWALVALANNPDVQKRLHDEIDAVITGDRVPTLQDEAKLPYVEATIMELTRWRTVIPLSVLRQTLQNSIVDGYFIPEGIMVIANLHAAHHDISVWKDPEVFRPERFLDDDNNVVGKEKIIPFSIGRRSCLGEILARAELFLIFTSLVKRFQVLPPEGQDKVDENPKVPATGALYPKAFKIRLIERK